ncbi:MAG: peptidyl-alpha-hydroxyglycine alpha-amidating lyase family protein [Vicinamibacterales bacterium]
MTRIFKALVSAGVFAFGVSLAAQGPAAPEIAFDSTGSLLTTPDNVFVGEVAGVGRNSRGEIFVYTRTSHPYATLGDNRTFFHNGSKLFVFDSTGKYLRELGQETYGFNIAFGLRVDPQDNVWTVDAGANQVVKFNPQGGVALVLGRKPEAINVRPAQPGGGGGGRGGPQGPPGAGTPGTTFNRPSDVAWDKAGNTYIADGMNGNVNRIVKVNKDGNFVKQWGHTGSGDGEFNGPKALAIDANGDVYVADSGNKRIQVFDGEGTFKRQFASPGNPLTMCMTTGATQYIYVSHSGDPDGMEDAAIYKVGLDGTVLGKFGSAGKLPKQFGLANSIDCRNEKELLVGEMTNWRVQKLTLK